MKYYDTVVEEDPSYYKKVLHTGNLGHVISHINYSSFNMLYNSIRSLPVDTEESTSNYKTEEEEETVELEELIKYEEDHPILSRLYNFYITALQNVSMVVLLLVLPILFFSNIVLLVFVAGPLTLLFVDYVTLRSLPAVAFQVLKGVLPAMVCYLISGTVLYFLGLYFSHSVMNGLCNELLDNSYQTAILLVFFACMVPTFPALFMQLVIAVSSNSVVYKSEGIYYRVRLPNSLWLRWRIGLFALVDLAFYFWIFYAGVMYVLAAGDPGSLVQAGCAIIFIAEVDKIFFEAYIRSEDREIMDKLFYEYPFFDEDKNIIHEKMNAVRKEMVVLKQKMLLAPPDAVKIMRAKYANRVHYRWSLFISSLSSLFTISTFIILNFPIYFILEWRKEIYCEDYCWNGETKSVETGSCSPSPGPPVTDDDSQGQGGPSPSPPSPSPPSPSSTSPPSPSSTSPPSPSPPSPSPPSPSPPSPSPPSPSPPSPSPPSPSPPSPSGPVLFSATKVSPIFELLYPAPTPRNVREVVKEFAASRHTLDHDRYTNKITDDPLAWKKASKPALPAHKFVVNLPQRNLFMGNFLPGIGR